MAFRILGPDEAFPERTRNNLPTRRNTEMDKIAAALRAGERVEIPIKPAIGAKRQNQRLSGALAYRGLAVSRRTTATHIYLKFSREVTPTKR